MAERKGQDGRGKADRAAASGGNHHDHDSWPKTEAG